VAHVLFCLAQLEAPVIVVGCKLDLRGEEQGTLDAVMAPIMVAFREIETCIECSALRQILVNMSAVIILC
jgi:Ras family protein T1